MALNIEGIYDSSMITNPETPSSSVGYMAYGVSAIATSFLSGMQAKEAAKTRAATYEIRKMQAETQAKRAELQGKNDIMNLQSSYNRAMASNAVMAAAQGRSGGSVAAVASAAEAQFNWDVDFTEISSQMQESGYQSQAEQYKIASSSKGGERTAISDAALKIGTSLYSIGS